MKVERRINLDSLANWLRAHLPPGLLWKNVPSGYGYRQCVYCNGNEPGVFGRLFESLGDPVGQVYGTTFELYHPQYYSDFQALLERFERETGIEPVLRYWEGAKISHSGGC